MLYSAFREAGNARRRLGRAVVDRTRPLDSGDSVCASLSSAPVPERAPGGVCCGVLGSVRPRSRPIPIGTTWNPSFAGPVKRISRSQISSSTSISQTSRCHHPACSSCSTDPGKLVGQFHGTSHGPTRTTMHTTWPNSCKLPTDWISQPWLCRSSRSAPSPRSPRLS